MGSRGRARAFQCTIFRNAAKRVVIPTAIGERIREEHLGNIWSLATNGREFETKS